MKKTHPNVPLTVYANGSGGLLERIKGTGADVIGIDWTVDMADARKRLGNDVSLQGNIDPTILFASQVSGVAGEVHCGGRCEAVCEAVVLCTCDGVVVDVTTKNSKPRSQAPPICKKPGPDRFPPPRCLHCVQDAIEAAIRDVVKKAGNKRHVLNLGHGVLVGTPEENVKFMFDLSKELKY